MALMPKQVVKSGLRKRFTEGTWLLFQSLMVVTQKYLYLLFIDGEHELHSYTCYLLISTIFEYLQCGFIFNLYNIS